MQIGGLQKLTLIDYPGRLAATVFVPGCNFCCRFCHNPELVTEINQNFYLSVEQVLDFLKSRKKYLEAVCITGGEPLLQPDLIDFISEIKKFGYLVKIDTNGTNPDALKEFINKHLVDYIALDIKTPLIWGNYKKAIGVDNRELFERILETIKILLNLNKNRSIDYEFRTTVVPRVLELKDLELIATQIKGVKKYFLQQFSVAKKMIDEDLKNDKPYTREELEAAKGRIKKIIKNCELRNC